MDESLLFMIAGGGAVLFLLMTVMLVRLWREQNKLKQDIRTLAAGLQRSADDVAGLCSAAVAVDKRLALNESRLSAMLDSVHVVQTPPQPAHDEEPEQEEAQGYDRVIEKIRQGANVEDLVKNCGLTRDEAKLLMRLHGR